MTDDAGGPTPGDVETLCERVCADYALGAFEAHEVVETGYEDLNVRVETSEGTYLAKVFDPGRDAATCRRYAALLSAAAAVVNHPRLLAVDGDPLHTLAVDGTTARLVVMEYVEGRRVDRLDRPLDETELRSLGRQARAIHGLDAAPVGGYDSWAVVNFERELDRARDLLEPEDRELIERVEGRFRGVDLDALPRRLVHYDLRGTNLLVGPDDDLYVLDFGVADRYPRVLEFVVLATTTCRGADAAETERRLATVLDAYDADEPFTAAEREAFPTLVEAARAMEVIRSTAERAGGDDSAETRRWLERGREALRRPAPDLPA